MTQLLHKSGVEFAFVFLTSFSPLVPASSPAARDVLAAVPLAFEGNRGQAPERVLYLGRLGGSTLMFTSDGAEIALPVFRGPEISPRLAWARPPEDLFFAGHEDGSRLRLMVSGADRTARVTARGPLAGRVHYLLGNDRGRWLRNVPLYSQIRYENVRPGVDLLFYGAGGDLEFDFALAPGADPSALRLSFEGADRLVLEDSGDIVLPTSAGPVRLRRPTVYQVEDGARVRVEGGFVRYGPGGIGFRVSRYDPSRRLIIDPVVTYSTYVGGSEQDLAAGVAMGRSGDLYLAGSTLSRDFPDPSIKSQTYHHGSWDAFVTRLSVSDENPSVVYSTYFGGGNVDAASAIVVDSKENVYLAGTTNSTNLPTSPNAIVPRYKFGDYDAFLAKLDPSGANLVYATYFGGGGDDRGHGLAIDAEGNAYLAGYTESWDLPITPGVFMSDQPGEGDGYVAKLNPTASALLYCTYLGGEAFDSIRDLKVDSTGAAYVGGLTYSDDLPTTPEAFQPQRNGHDDSWAAKLNPDGGALAYCTYIGGNCEEEAIAIDIDSDGCLFFTGYAETHNFPATPGAFQPTHHGGGFDAIVAKLNPAGTGLEYATYLGGQSNDMGLDIVVDPLGLAWVTGYTRSHNFPTTAGANRKTIRGTEDAFLSVLDATGSALAWSSFFGGRGRDSGEAVLTDAAGAAWLLGWTASTDFETTPGALRRGYGGGSSDLFLTRLTPSALASTSAASFAPNTAVAAESIVSGFGGDLAEKIRVAETASLPVELDGVRLIVRDSAGLEQSSPLFFVAPGQINFQVPAGAAEGLAAVTVIRHGLTVSMGTLEITGTSPSLFTANADGRGAPAAFVQGVRADGSPTMQLVYECGAAAGSCVPTPISPSSGGGPSYLILYGTGIRGRSALSQVEVTVGGIKAEVVYAGPQGYYVGLDQINVRLGPAFAGMGRQVVRLTVDGKAANEVVIECR